MPEPCRPCRYWTNPGRGSYVAGELTFTPRCWHWISSFPNEGPRCPRYEREPGSDDE